MVAAARIGTKDVVEVAGKKMKWRRDFNIVMERGSG